MCRILACMSVIKIKITPRGVGNEHLRDRRGSKEKPNFNAANREHDGVLCNASGQPNLFTPFPPFLLQVQSDCRALKRATPRRRAAWSNATRAMQWKHVRLRHDEGNATEARAT